jgi:hypothetical protein
LTTTAAASGETVLALRVGDSGEPGNGEDFAELEVRGDDGRTQIEFLPHGATRPTPGVTVVSRARCSAL